MFIHNTKYVSYLTKIQIILIINRMKIVIIVSSFYFEKKFYKKISKNACIWGLLYDNIEYV